MKITNKYRQHILVDRVLVITCLSAIFGLAGCQQEGTGEKTGKKIDHAVENVEQKYDLATTKADQKMEEAKESLDQKVGKVQEAINESTEASKGALEKTGIKIDLATEKLESKVGSVKESVVEKTETAGTYIDDSVITMNVKTAILNDSLLNASHIDVTTVKGVVKLTGTVDSEQSIGRAMEMANSQKNVKSVETDLTVKATTLGK